MTYASILTVLTGAPDDAVTLTAAARQVRGQGGEVRVVLALPTLATLMFSDGMAAGYMSPEVIELIEQGNTGARRQVEALASEITTREGLELDDNGGRIRFLPEQPIRAFDMLSLTPFCDLVMVGASTFQSFGVWSGLVSGALMEARTPFMIVRREPDAPEVVAIAWDGSQSAGRAVRAAMPAICAAARVVVLQDPDHISLVQRQAADLQALADYLRLHGIAKVERVLKPGMARGDGLAQAVSQTGAGTLVAGAFGHARLLEAVFGGATGDLLKSARTFNLLLSH